MKEKPPLESVAQYPISEWRNCSCWYLPVAAGWDSFKSVGNMRSGRDQL